MGISDIVATAVYYVLMTNVGMARSFTYLFLLLAVSSLILVIVLGFTHADQKEVVSTGLSASLSILVILMRIGSFSTFAVNYSQVIELTPTLMIGLVFGIVNTVARGITIFAPLVAELVPNSSWTCTVLAVTGMIAVRGFHAGTKLE